MLILDAKSMDSISLQDPTMRSPKFRPQNHHNRRLLLRKTQIAGGVLIFRVASLNGTLDEIHFSIFPAFHRPWEFWVADIENHQIYPLLTTDKLH